MTVTRCYVLRTSLLEENWTRQTSQTYFFPSNEPKNKSGGGRATVPVVQVATRNINNLILKATIEVDNAPERIAFYRSLSTDKSESFRSTANPVLKTCLHVWLSAYPAPTSIPSTGMRNNMSLEIPVCSKDQSIPLTDVKTIRNVPHLFCLATVPETCAPNDTIVCTDEVIITVQPVSSRHCTELESSDFDQIHAYFSLLFGESRQWYHVSVTGDVEDAEALQYRPRDDIPADLNVMQ